MVACCCAVCARCRSARSFVYARFARARLLCGGVLCCTVVGVAGVRWCVGGWGSYPHSSTYLRTGTGPPTAAVPSPWRAQLLIHAIHEISHTSQVSFGVIRKGVKTASFRVHGRGPCSRAQNGLDSPGTWACRYRLQQLQNTRARRRPASTAHPQKSRFYTCRGPSHVR